MAAGWRGRIGTHTVPVFASLCRLTFTVRLPCATQVSSISAAPVPPMVAICQQRLVAFQASTPATRTKAETALTPAAVGPPALQFRLPVAATTASPCRVQIEVGSAGAGSVGLGAGAWVAVVRVGDPSETAGRCCASLESCPEAAAAAAAVDALTATSHLAKVSTFTVDLPARCCPGVPGPCVIATAVACVVLATCIGPVPSRGSTPVCMFCQACMRCASSPVQASSTLWRSLAPFASVTV